MLNFFPICFHCVFSYSRYFLILSIFFIFFNILFFFQFLYLIFLTNSILFQYIYDIKSS